MGLGGGVAGGKASVVVQGADEAVEVDFLEGGHGVGIWERRAPARLVAWRGLFKRKLSPEPNRFSI